MADPLGRSPSTRRAPPTCSRPRGPTATRPDAGAGARVSSAEVYGIQRAERMPLDEQRPCGRPTPTRASKSAAEAFALAWRSAYGLDCRVARPFNHIGPGQDARFVVASFARQLATIAAGSRPVMYVGNLEAQRDFLDVRDVAAAYVRARKRARAAKCITSVAADAVAIREVLAPIDHHRTRPREIRDDPERMRPPIAGVVRRRDEVARRDGLGAAVALADSLRDIYADARTWRGARVSESTALDAFVFARRGELLAVPAVVLAALGKPSAFSIASVCRWRLPAKRSARGRSAIPASPRAAMPSPRRRWSRRALRLHAQPALCRQFHHGARLRGRVHRRQPRRRAPALVAGALGRCWASTASSCRTKSAICGRRSARTSTSTPPPFRGSSRARRRRQRQPELRSIGDRDAPNRGPS